MTTKRFLIGFTAAAIVIIAAACSVNQSGSSAPVEKVMTHDQLLAALQSVGIDAVPAGDITQPFFEPVGKIIKVNDQEIQVFEFSTAGDAEIAAGTISPEGSSIGTSMVAWIAPPHFYRAGNIIVLYLGNEGNLVKGLEDMLGGQIAGR